MWKDWELNWGTGDVYGCCLIFWVVLQLMVDILVSKSIVWFLTKLSSVPEWTVFPVIGFKHFGNHSLYFVMHRLRFNQQYKSLVKTALSIKYLIIMLVYSSALMNLVYNYDLSLYKSLLFWTYLSLVIL